MKRSDFHYELPPELIAQHPLPGRSDSRLLALDHQGVITHRHFRELPGLLGADDLLVFNDTRVIPAKLVGFRTSTRGRWQGLFLEADESGNWRMNGVGQLVQ